MSWPLTGKPLAEFNRLLSDWRQYGTFPFIGSDDILRLFNVLIAAGVPGVTLEDLGNRPQYWLAQLSIHIGNTISPPMPGDATNIIVEDGTDSSATIRIQNLGKYKTITSELTVFNSLGIQQMPELTSVSFLLADLFPANNGSINIFSNPLLTEIKLPLVSSGAYWAFDNNPSLTSISFPGLTSLLGDFIFGTGYGNPASSALTTIDLPNWLPDTLSSGGGKIDFNGCALSQTSVDSILSRCVASANFTLGTLDLSGGTNSPPSSIGPGSDYDTLIGRGITVLVNP